MAVDIATIGIAVDTKDLRTGTRDLDTFGRSANNASGATDKTSKSMAGMGAVVSRLAGLLGSAGLALSLVQVTDQYTKLNAQLNIASRSQADYTKSLQDVVRISNLAQTSLEGTATLYSRLANTLKDTNVTQQQFANITESVALGLRVSGASTAEAQSAMLQLSQAFASGVLRGEEFNAVSEASFPLMKALADSMGIPIEQLRSMAQEGKITRDELVKAFGDPALIATFQNQAKELNTVGGAFQVLKNNLTIVIGEINKTTGASNSLAQALTNLANSSAIRVPFETLAVLGLNVAFVFNTIGKELYGIYARAEALAKLDFKGFANISKILAEDAKAARAEVDRLSEEIVNPKSAQSPNSLPAQAEQLNTSLSSAVTTTGKLSEAEKEYQRILQNRKDANAEILDLQNITVLLKQGLDIEEARFRVESARRGLLPAQIEALLKENEIQASIAEEEQARQDRLKLWIATQQKGYDDEIKRIEEVTKLQQKQANDNFKQAQDAQKEIDRENERISESFSRSLTDAIFRGFESGKSFAENFKDTLINSFRTLVLRPVIEFIVNSTGIAGAIQGAIGSITGQGGTASFVDGIMQQRQGGIAGIFSDIGNIFTSTQNSVLSGIEGVGASISNGLGGIRDSIGGFVGANAKLVSTGLGVAGAALQIAQGNIGGGVGTGLGLLLSGGNPLGGAIGSFLGSAVGGLFGGKKQPPRTVSQLPDVSEAFNQSLSTLIQGFGGAGNVTGSANYTGRAGGSGYGNLFATIDGKRFVDRTKDAGGYSEQAMQAFVTRTLTTTLVKAIQGTAIPSAFRNLFKGLTDQQDIASTINAVVKLNQSNTDLISNLGITSQQVALLAKESGIAGANLSSFVDAITSTKTSLVTIGDELVRIKGNIDSTFKEFSNQALPANLKAFDQALKAINTNTKAGRADFLGLLQLRTQFAEFDTAITGLKGNVKGALFGIVSDAERQQIMNDDLAKLFGDLNREVPASIQELIALGKSIDYTTAEGLNLASVFPALVDAFNQTKGAVDALLTSLNPNNFSTFADFAVGASLARQGVPVSRIPSSGLATPFVPNQSSTTDNGQVASLLQALLAEMKGLNQTSQATAESTRRTASELELITEGSVTLNTTGA